MSGALPVTKLRVDGRECRALVDTGCTDTIVYAPCCKQWRPRPVVVTTLSGDPFRCSGIGSVSVETLDGQRAQLDVLVVDSKPMGVDMILGMSGISSLGGISIRRSSDIRFCGVASRLPLEVDAPDFTAWFDESEKAWMVAWKWADGVGPDCLINGVAQYAVPPAARQEFDQELDSWISNGWLVPYDEQQHGPPRGLVPLMAVLQTNKAKVRPVLDYRELNSHVTAHTADADVCADQLRKWRRHGTNIAVVDLKKAYLQLRVDQRLWPFQTVVIRGQRYCLTRLGFGLNVAPLVMKAVVRAVLALDPEMERAVLPYVDDLLVNEDMVSAERVMAHFAECGLECKPPERVSDGARLLGLRVRPEQDELRWSRDNPVDAPPAQMTRRAIFSWCGRLVAHLPVCGWLRPAAAWLKRRVNAVTRGWDDVTEDAALRTQVDYVAARLVGDDPARGPWCVQGEHAIVWTDASSLAAGVVVESPDGGTVEDACWLRRDDSTHINMAELDAAMRGINLAIAWGMKSVDLRTDSATVHKWIEDALSGRARLRTKAHGEMLIRRRIDVIRQLREELEIKLTVTLVRSAENRADVLTRVPKEWLRDRDDPPVAGAAVAAAADRDDDTRGRSGAGTAAIAEVHERAGHPGIRRTRYFARRDISRGVTRAQVRAVVANCDVCQAIDPAPVTWRHGSLDVRETWWRLAIDITHYQNRSYLTIIDCGPSRFSLWRQLRRPDADCVVEHLEQAFFERGAPVELLSDNDTVIRGRRFEAFAARWGVSLRIRAVHEPGGNGIVERSHRTVKVIAARKSCPIGEAVHLYNVAPRDGEEAANAPVSGIYKYTVRDCVRPASDQPSERRPVDGQELQELPDGAVYAIGDTVWVRRRGTRCTEWSRPGVVTGIVSPQVVEIHGVPWHVRDLRHRVAADEQSTAESSDEDDDVLPLEIVGHVDPRPADGDVVPRGRADVPGDDGAVDSDDEADVVFPHGVEAVVEEGDRDVGANAAVEAAAAPERRRSTRVRHAPRRFCCDQ